MSHKAALVLSRSHKYHGLAAEALDKSFLGRQFQHVVKFQSRRCKLLFLWVVGAVMAPLAARHVKEDEKADDGNKEHPAGNRGNDKHKKTLFLSLAASAGGHKDRLDESLLRGDLQHVVQLEAWGGGLLFGRPIVAFSLPLTPSHHQEDEQPNQGNESHASHNWPNNQGQLFT